MTPSETSWSRELLDAPHQVADKASRVRQMFNAIAPRYELINTVFSGGRDAYWRRKAVALCAARSNDDVLDIASGTGDFARAFQRAGVGSVAGCDFAHEMLVRALRAGSADQCRVDGGESHASVREATWVEADALRLPFVSGGFSITSCAFGIRNFRDLDSGFREMYRVLRPGGRAVILEFSRPRNPVTRTLYEVYSTRFMPVAASWLSGDRTGAYRYLPRSVVSFADPPELCRKLQEAGFVEVNATPLTWGVVTVFVARRS